MSSVWQWSAFAGLIVALVALDLGVHRGRHGTISPRSALVWSAVWIGLALAFGVGVYLVRGSEAAVAFYTAYLLEKSLSVDNLLLFLLVFRHFRVPVGEQHRVLTWGILGALVFRGLLIIGGIELIHRWHSVVYVFGAFLLFLGVRTMISPPEERPLDESRLIRTLRRILPISASYDGGRFFTIVGGRRVGTLLLLVLAVIEVTDLVFAVDSIPAVFAVTDDSFLVFTSNIFAILGLRALYFALADLLSRLRFLRFGLGIILLLAGAKMCLGELVHVPAAISLAATVAILGATVAASLLPIGRKPQQDAS